MALGELEQLILLVILRLDDNAYGVTIREHLLHTAHRKVALPTVYTTLDRLESKGHVTTRLGDPTAERGGRRKRFYRLTASGQRAVKASLTALRALTRDLSQEFQP